MPSRRVIAVVSALGAGAPRRLLLNDFPPWEIVNQQTQRRLAAAVFGAMARDLRALLRVAARPARGLRSVW